MKNLLLLLFITNFCFGQKIIDEIDEFTGDRVIKYTNINKKAQPIIIVEQPGQAIPIKEIKQFGEKLIMTITVNGNHFFNAESELWFLMENGTKYNLPIELYGDILHSPNFYSDSYTSSYYSYLDFLVPKGFVDEMANGDKIKTMRLFSTDGYLDYKNSGYTRTSKESKRMQYVVNWFSNVKKYYEKIN